MEKYIIKKVRVRNIVKVKKLTIEYESKYFGKFLLKAKNIRDRTYTDNKSPERERYVSFDVETQRDYYKHNEHYDITKAISRIEDYVKLHNSTNANNRIVSILITKMIVYNNDNVRFLGVWKDTNGQTGEFNSCSGTMFAGYEDTEVTIWIDSHSLK